MSTRWWRASKFFEGRGGTGDELVWHGRLFLRSDEAVRVLHKSTDRMSTLKGTKEEETTDDDRGEAQENDQV